MRCEEVQNLIAIESDGALLDGESVLMNQHLLICPLCRQERDDIRNLTRDLRMLNRPVVSQERLFSLRSAVAESLGAPRGFWLSEDRRPWTQAWLMPSGLGTLATVLLSIGFLWLLSVSPMQVDNTTNFAYTTYQEPTQLAYAGQRSDVAKESPSINPHGALVALTNSLVRGQMNDDEVVVVAEVFGNGLAQIDEVVEPSKNRLAVGDLDRALKSDPRFAPFVPADLDQRPDSVKVILKIQNVNVSTRIKARGL